MWPYILLGFFAGVSVGVLSLIVLTIISEKAGILDDNKE